MRVKEYKVVVYAKGMWDSLYFGVSKVNPDKFSELLNKYANDGWRVISVTREKRGMWIVHHREAYVVVMERDR